MTPEEQTAELIVYRCSTCAEWADVAGVLLELPRCTASDEAMEPIPVIPLSAVEGLVEAGEKVAAHRTVLNEAWDTVLVDAEDQLALIKALEGLKTGTKGR